MPEAEQPLEKVWVKHEPTGSVSHRSYSANALFLYWRTADSTWPHDLFKRHIGLV